MEGNSAAKGKTSLCHQCHSFQMTLVSLDSVTMTLFASGTLRCANKGEKRAEGGTLGYCCYCLLSCFFPSATNLEAILPSRASGDFACLEKQQTKTAHFW